MSLFWYISLGWAVNGMIWNRGAYDMQERKREGWSLPQPSSKDMCALPIGQPSHESCHLRHCTLPAASSSVIPTVAFSNSVTGRSWQNFSYLSSKSKQNSYMMNGSQPRLIAPWKEIPSCPLFFRQMREKYGRHDIVGRELNQRIFFCFNQY